jgi:hypothetical protein
VEEYESAELHMRATRNLQSDAGREFVAAWMALAYRLIDVADYDEDLLSALATHGAAPPVPERYQQERLLFAYFVSGLSALESFAYGVHALAALVDPTHFPFATDSEKRAINPTALRGRLYARFPNEGITAELADLVDSPEFAEWTLIRNVLVHRTAIARHHHVHLGSGGGERTTRWGDVELTEETTSTRRGWLVAVVRGLLEEAGRFSTKLRPRG